jgi:hypothetical protein
MAKKRIGILTGTCTSRVAACVVTSEMITHLSILHSDEEN